MKTVPFLPLTCRNHKVVDMLGDSIVKKEDYVHSYPYDWRTKQPVITVASLQWFVRNDKIKEDALRALEGVTTFPDPEKNKTEMMQRVKQVRNLNKFFVVNTVLNFCVKMAG